MTLSSAFPAALLLAIPALALLLLFRLLRAKRHRVFAGSLLIWKRLAALASVAKPKRIVFDLSILLQAAAVMTLCAALAQVEFKPSTSSARTLLLVVDNGTLSRARDGSGKPAFQVVLAASKSLLDHLNISDRIFIARAAPAPVLLNAAPFNTTEARSALNNITPALSGPDAASICLFATDRARSLDSGALTTIISLQPEPPESQNATATRTLWQQPSLVDPAFNNVAIVEAGSMSVDSKTNGGPRVLIRVANFSNQKVDGKVVLETLDASSNMLEEKALALEPRGEGVAAFRIAPEIKSALRITWHNAKNMPDALPEDDSVVLAPRPEHAPRVRLHTPHPALEKLLRLALNATIVAPDAKDENHVETDLDVFIGSVPERLPDDTRAALFIAPERGYRSYFDTSDKVLTQPSIQRGDDSPLTAGIAVSAQAGIAIPKAYEILHTGDFATLLRDAATGRPLAARFTDEKSRPIYVLAFSPGDGLAAERALDPALAALLVRMTLEAARAGPPYARVKAADLELAANQPLPLNWRPARAGNPPNGAGVLDERASDLRFKKSSGASPDNINALLAAPAVSSAPAWDLTPWLLIAALAFAAAEFYVSEIEIARPNHTG